MQTFSVGENRFQGCPDHSRKEVCKLNFKKPKKPTTLLKTDHKMSVVY